MGTEMEYSLRKVGEKGVVSGMGLGLQMWSNGRELALHTQDPGLELQHSTQRSGMYPER